ncbi:beta-lactamase family protein [Reichenbachiella carrageenanivorans]|uniref:Beta-lactamase family protein n=1 Tax=Reichenbachiella carrageenanivorans TaxID=2979869 RepID=A0ABY6D1N5_9BACT|nr:serine hydrolase domain-containing protein [Reichenbachiella carrageenanivorans]UXX80066.1 beta-lactamase family protein [Reichenbachiella carrageenanivorans]
MNQIKTITLSVLFLCLVTAACKTPIETRQEDKYKDAIELSRMLVDSIQRTYKVPGMDVAVAIAGQTVWSESFGLADVELNAPVIAGQTRFRVGSVAKPLTAVALAKLMEADRIDIDLPVQVYVPYFPEKAYTFSTRQLSGHIAGIRSYQNNEFLNKKHYQTVKEGLSMFMNDSLVYEPGTAYTYSSHGYNLLSAVIEGASGEAFLPFMHKTIFRPLGMLSTCEDQNDSIISDRTSFYRLSRTDSLQIENAPYVDNSYKWAGGGFVSTTSDLIKFGEAMMQPGFLSEPTLEEITTPQMLKNGKKTHYGIGWEIGRHGDKQVYGHGGGSVGGITVFRIYPEDQLVIVMLSNSSNTKYGEIPKLIVEAFLSEKRQ